MGGGISMQQSDLMETAPQLKSPLTEEEPNIDKVIVKETVLFQLNKYQIDKLASNIFLSIIEFICYICECDSCL